MVEKVNRLQRKKALGMDEVLPMYIKAMGLGPALNCHRIYKAWEEASGAEKYTMKKFYRDGKLYITLSSSVIRTQLGFSKDAIILKINSLLESDELFLKDLPKVSFVKELILK